MLPCIDAGLMLTKVSDSVMSTLHISANIAWTACGEPCHDVCNHTFTIKTALPCRVLKPAAVHWMGNHLISALVGYSLRDPFRSDFTLDCLVCHCVIVLDVGKYWHV